MVLRTLLACVSLAGVLCLTLSAGPAGAQSDPSQPDSSYGDQYRCDRSGTRCATFRCDPGSACGRTSAWEPRDYSRGVDGDAPPYDSFTTGDPAAAASFDRRRDTDGETGQGYDRRYDSRPGSGGYDERYVQRRGEGYDEDGYDFRRDQGGVNDYARSGAIAVSPGRPSSPDEVASSDGEDEDQDAAAGDGPGYSYQHAPPRSEAWQDRRPDWRCTDDGRRCAYFRCDPEGETCRRISGWASRADADRRPDWDGW